MVVGQLADSAVTLFTFSENGRFLQVDIAIETPSLPK